MISESQLLGDVHVLRNEGYVCWRKLQRQRTSRSERQRQKQKPIGQLRVGEEDGQSLEIPYICKMKSEFGLGASLLLSIITLCSLSVLNAQSAIGLSSPSLSRPMTISDSGRAFVQKPTDRLLVQGGMGNPTLDELSIATHSHEVTDYENVLCVRFRQGMYPRVRVGDTGYPVTCIRAVDSLNIEYGCNLVEKRFKVTRLSSSDTANGEYYLHFIRPINVDTLRELYLQSGAFSQILRSTEMWLGEDPGWSRGVRDEPSLRTTGTQRPAYTVSGIMEAPIWDGKPIDPHCGKVNGCDGRPPRHKAGSGKPAGGTLASQVDDLALSGSKLAVAQPLAVYRQFTANNLDEFTPGDNSMGISRNGFIVSADNYTIDYYGDGPDSLLQFQLHHDFYGDSTLRKKPFDPRVIYDRYANRFIVVTCAFADTADTYLLISFSRDEDPRNGWNHYRLRSDTLDDNQWFDFPSVSINSSELFISGNMFADLGNGTVTGNKIFQIRKADGYAGQTLKFRLWMDVLDSEGDIAYCMVPLQDGLMRDSYNRGIYLASTKLIYSGQSSDKLFWYQITDSFNAPGVALDTHMTSSGIPYSDPLNAYQLGSNDQIELTDAKVHSGFVMDSVLNFVYCRDFQNYSVIVLNRLDLRTNINQRYPWGFTAGSQDFSFPSIAFMGADSTDPDNLALCFLKTSTNIYPQIDVVHFDDGAFHQSSTVVRQGDGFIDFYNGNQVERWGDYTTIQRRYDSQPARAWLVAGYPNGTNPNFFGAVNLFNAYIAEVGDSIALSIQLQGVPGWDIVTFYPNPAIDHLTVAVSEPGRRILQVELVDVHGVVLIGRKADDPVHVELDLGGVASGLYFARIQLNGNQVAYEKVVVAPVR